MTTIDFTNWTDAQLNSALIFADSSPTGLALVAEIDRRKTEGIWLTDGSTERARRSSVITRPPAAASSPAAPAANHQPQPNNTMDIEYIKQHRSLTLEYGRGETYRSNNPTLYGHSTYGRSSVLAGRPRRVYLESWDDLDTARAELKAAKIRYADLCETGGSTHIPVDVITAGLPDEDI